MLTAAQSHAESTDKGSWHHPTQLLQVGAALSAWADLHDKGKLPSKLLIASAACQCKHGHFNLENSGVSL